MTNEGDHGDEDRARVRLELGLRNKTTRSWARVRRKWNYTQRRHAIVRHVTFFGSFTFAFILLVGMKSSRQCVGEGPWAQERFIRVQK